MSESTENAEVWGCACDAIAERLREIRATAAAKVRPVVLYPDYPDAAYRCIEAPVDVVVGDGRRVTAVLLNISRQKSEFDAGNLYFRVQGRSEYDEAGDMTAADARALADVLDAVVVGAPEFTATTDAPAVAVKGGVRR